MFTLCRYDSFVIYNFVSLCMALAGGPGAIVSQSENVVVRRCCLPPQQVDGNFLRRQGHPLLGVGEGAGDHTFLTRNGPQGDLEPECDAATSPLSSS